MLAVLWFDNFVTLLTTSPGKLWKHKQNMWKGSSEKNVCQSRSSSANYFLYVSPQRNSQFPLKMSPSRPWDPALWYLRLVRAGWKEQSSSHPIWLLFCAHCNALVERSAFEEQLSVAVIVLESIRQNNAKFTQKHFWWSIYYICGNQIPNNVLSCRGSLVHLFLNIWRGDYMWI